MRCAGGSGLSWEGFGVYSDRPSRRSALEPASDDISVPNLALGEGNNHERATGEHEIAKIGPIAPQDIVAFRHVKDLYTLDGAVHFRASFRKRESQPFACRFDILSGMQQ